MENAKVQLVLRPWPDRCRVTINGVDVPAVSVKVEQSVETFPLVTVSFHGDVDADIEGATVKEE